ncbi:hypothetical protein BDB00DRAFT_872207 [Zychaea mexicana]|uniref:uncharacterized protein n=1 Tax=Zychaea mexicana TaxID=64656 RepID=UPI0022FE9F81|nr:uncharacterized protein BDB00DRAFT_872207 [Zychaea mexicana]KAI9493527.1 hypothetical protein BDB00DRAFT_872207 [Zychaea mexicana]
MAPRRVYNNTNGGRVVTLGGGGGLNERFSNLDKSKQQQPEPPRGNVFSRIRGAPINNNNIRSARRNTSNIQNRLSKPVSAGIRKRSGPTPMQGVAQVGGRGSNQRNTNVVSRRRDGRNTTPRRGQQQQRGSSTRGAPNKQQQQQQRGGGSGRGAAGGGRGRSNDKSRKPVSAQDLDKSLDDYMMKDSKTAQSRLDAELNSYMDEGGDVLMDL